MSIDIFSTNIYNLDLIFYRYLEQYLSILFVYYDNFTPIKCLSLQILSFDFLNCEPPTMKNFDIFMAMEQEQTTIIALPVNKLAR